MDNYPEPDYPGLCRVVILTIVGIFVLAVATCIGPHSSSTADTRTGREELRAVQQAAFAHQAENRVAVWLR